MRVVFLTNNAGATVAEHLAKLGRMGVAAGTRGPADVRPGRGDPPPAGLDGAAVRRGEGVREALAAAGIRMVECRGRPTRSWWGGTGRSTTTASPAPPTRSGPGPASIGTNEDATYPTPGGLLPGAGALLAAVATASGAVPEVAGKPHPPMLRLIAERLGRVETVVGDRPSTDGALAQALGARFALVLSGVTGDAATADPAPDVVAPDLAALVPSAHPGADLLQGQAGVDAVRRRSSTRPERRSSNRPGSKAISRRSSLTPNSISRSRGSSHGTSTNGPAPHGDDEAAVADRERRADPLAPPARAAAGGAVVPVGDRPGDPLLLLVEALRGELRPEVVRERPAAEEETAQHRG